MENQLLASIEAEISVIGGILVSPIAFSEVSAIVSAGDFSKEAHRRIFSAMTAMDAAGQPIDVLTIAEWMESKGDFAGRRLGIYRDRRKRYAQRRECSGLCANCSR
jgi:replicative DNA helicase